jgi:hypothetical protein
MSDFSKGEFDYKQKWGNLKYDFEYHIFYDKTSMKAKITASLIEKYFKFKLYLRERDFNVLYRKIEFLFSFKKKRNKHNIKVVNESVFQNDNQYDKIDLSHKNYAFLNKYVYTYLFANSQPFDEIEIYKSKLKNEFIISGNKNSQRLVFLT